MTANERCGRESHERQQRVEQETHDDHPDQRGARGHEGPSVDENRAHRVDVAGHPRDKVAGVAALVEAERSRWRCA